MEILSFYVLPGEKISDLILGKSGFSLYRITCFLLHGVMVGRTCICTCAGLTLCECLVMNSEFNLGHLEIPAMEFWYMKVELARLLTILVRNCFKVHVASIFKRCNLVDVHAKGTLALME